MILCQFVFNPADGLRASEPKANRIPRNYIKKEKPNLIHVPILRHNCFQHFTIEFLFRKAISPFSFLFQGAFVIKQPLLGASQSYCQLSTRDFDQNGLSHVFFCRLLFLFRLVCIFRISKTTWQFPTIQTSEK